MNSQTIFAVLRDVLAELYLEEQDARIVVTDAGLDTKQIAFSFHPQANWHNILTEAIYQKRLQSLLSVALTSYSDNVRLKDAYSQYQYFIAQEGDIIAPSRLLTDENPPQSIGVDSGAYVAHDVVIQAGDFVGRDKYVIGDEVSGNKIEGDQFKVQGSNGFINRPTGPVIQNFGPVTNFQMFTDAPPTLSKRIRIAEFQSLVNERTRDFVGRDFIFKAIDNFQRKPDFPSGYIVITGEPGIGKTSLIAELVKRTGSVHHFNIALQGIRTAQQFLENVCAQLIVRYGLPYSSLQPEATRDSGFLSTLLSEIASASQDQNVIILLDSLDEAEDIGLPQAANRLFLPATLPNGIYFVVTTRPQRDYRLSVDRREDIYLNDNDSQNLDDVRQYIHDFVKKHQAVMIPQIQTWGVDEGQFVEIITGKSEGNFMYLVYVLQDIRNGKLAANNVDEIRNLPQGLREYYRRHWRLMSNQDQERFEKYYEPVVCVLATAREPVTIGKVVEWTKLPLLRVQGVIRDWYEFLNIDPSKAEALYRIYHVSFQDFLKEEVGLKRYHNMIVRSTLDKIIRRKHE